eukprot:4303652-Pyramimonas_sp.AAC.2
MCVVNNTPPHTETVGGSPYGPMGPRNARRVCRNVRGQYTPAPTGAVGGAPIWGHEAREGCAEMGVISNAPAPTLAFGGAPYWATKRVRGVPKCAWSITRPRPLGPSVELPMEPRSA